MPGYVTDREAAHLTGLSLAELHDLIEDNQLPNIPTNTHLVEISHADLEALA